MSKIKKTYIIRDVKTGSIVPVSKSAYNMLIDDCIQKGEPYHETTTNLLHIGEDKDITSD